MYFIAMGSLKIILEPSLLNLLYSCNNYVYLFIHSYTSDPSQFAKLGKTDSKTHAFGEYYSVHRIHCSGRAPCKNEIPLHDCAFNFLFCIDQHSCGIPAKSSGSGCCSLQACSRPSRSIHSHDHFVSLLFWWTMSCIEYSSLGVLNSGKLRNKNIMIILCTKTVSLEVTITHS